MMKIELREITVKELSNGYQDSQDEGVSGFAVNLTFVHNTNENLFTNKKSGTQLSILLQRIFL